MKLHIGAGERYLPGYKHLDIIDRPHIDYVCDIRDLSRFADETVVEIYACHVLEHVNRHEILDMLKEWHRVTMRGGVLRLAVPDFKAIVDEYISGGTLDSVLGLLYGGQDYEYNFHYQTYDLDRLSILLTKAGFGNIKEYDWRMFLPEDYDDFSKAYLPHKDFENGRHMSLNIVASKGENAR